MVLCVNEECNRDPLASTEAVVVSIDGDMACSPECTDKYKKQMDHFCSEVLADDQKFADHIGVNISTMIS